MTYYLDGTHSAEKTETTVSELAEQFHAEAPGDENELIDDLLVALVEFDTLLGDDPVKYAAMQKLVGALKYFEDSGEGEIRLTASANEVGIEKIPR